MYECVGKNGDITDNETSGERCFVCIVVLRIFSRAAEIIDINLSKENVAIRCAFQLCA